MHCAPPAMNPEPEAKSHTISICHRHPAEPVTGVCALCLGERLSFLDSSGEPESCSSASTASILPAPEPIILSSSIVGAAAVTKASSRRTRPSAAVSSSLQPELSRSRSYSASKCGASSFLSEPRRKSCDVRVRNTLWHLFSLDDEEKDPHGKTEVESKNIGSSGERGSVPRSGGEVENGDKIRVSRDAAGQNVNVDEQRFEEIDEEFKTMKEHIELELQTRKHTGRELKDIAGSFREAASVFSQKLRRWTLKQRMKKRRGGSAAAAGSRGGDLLQTGKLNGRQLRETQSEVGEYGYGRRSCDTDPRFSVDAGRISLDDPRFSLDEPRASWDGYMIAKTIPRLAPMLSVFENVRIPPINTSENRILVEGQMHSIHEDEMTSGGSDETTDQCSDSSSSQRQNSSACSSSGKSSSKKTTAPEVDETKSKSNTMVSPATIDVCHRMKFVVAERETRDSDFNLEHDHLERFGSASKDDISIADVGNLKGFMKPGRWRRAWNILGFKHRLGETQHGGVGGPTMSHPLGDSSEKQSGDNSGDGAFGGKLVRSGSYRTMGSYRRSLSVAESRGCSKKNREESALERNRSAKYSPSNFDNGLLRFYLTPLWSYKRSKSAKSRFKKSHSIARSVLRSN